MIVFLNMARFAIALVLLPVVVALTQSFLSQMAPMKVIFRYFTLGVGSYVVMHLFIMAPQSGYRFFQKIFAETLKFSSFLSNNVPLLVPLAATLLLVVHYILLQFVDPKVLSDYFIFATGFTWAMHLILSAHDIADEDTSAFKPHYFCMMTVVFIANILLIALLMDINFTKFSMASFMQDGWSRLMDLYQLAGKKIMNF